VASGKRMGVDMGMRCKQCNQPITSANMVESPFGVFCSEACKEKYEAFVQRAQQLESMRKPFSLGRVLKGFIGKLIVILILLVALGVLGTVMPDIPVLSDLVRTVREWASNLV
jgi:hypothetical protein